MSRYLEQVLAIDASELRARDVRADLRPRARRRPSEIVGRDAKDYEVGGGQTLRIAQVETVGQGLHERRDELLTALDDVREREGHVLAALMVTDIVAQGHGALRLR